MNSEWENITNELKGAKAPLSKDAWGNMNAILDKEASTKKRKMVLWLLPLLLLGSFSWILVETGFINSKEIETSDEIENPIQDNKLEDNVANELNTPQAQSENSTVETEVKTPLKIKNVTPIEKPEEEQSVNLIARNLDEDSNDLIQNQTEETELNSKACTRLDTPTVKPELLALEPEELPIEIKPKSKVSQRGWALKAYAGPTYNMPNVQYKEQTNYTHHNLNAATTDALKAGWGFDAGLELSYQFNRFLKLGTGIGFRKIITTNSYDYQVKEIPVIDSASGMILGYVPSSTTLPTEDIEATSNNFTYVGIPVSLFYEHSLNSKWSVTGELVNSFNFLLQQNSYLVNSKSLELQATDQNTFNPMVVSYQFRFGINYSLTPKLKAAIEPSYRGHYTNIYNSEEVIWKPKDFAIHIALIYSINN